MTKKRRRLYEIHKAPRYGRHKRRGWVRRSPWSGLQVATPWCVGLIREQGDNLMPYDKNGMHATGRTIYSTGVFWDEYIADPETMETEIERKIYKRTN